MSLEPQCFCQCRTFGLVLDVESLRAVNLHWKGSACRFWTLTTDHSSRPHCKIQCYWFRLSAVKQGWTQQWNLILKQHNVASWLFFFLKNRAVILLDLAALGLVKLSGLCNLSKAFCGLLAQRSTIVGFMVVQSREREPASPSSSLGSPGGGPASVQIVACGLQQKY